MHTATTNASSVTSEGRHLSGGAVSAEWLSELGPREENQDRALCWLEGDGSWLVAVADGLGGPPSGPRHSTSSHQVAASAHRHGRRDVHSVQDGQRSSSRTGPRRLRCSRREAHRCPASTLCVIAWTPSGGLLVGIAGDTRPVLLWRDDELWSGRSLGRLHRNISIYGYVTKYLSAPRDWLAMGATDSDPMEIIADDIDLPADISAIAIIIASDGVWEPLVRDVYAGKTKQADLVGKAIAVTVGPDDRDAHTIATRIMDTAQTAGLNDNATVAVACIAEQPVSEVA